LQSSGASRREDVKVRLDVIASAAKQSIFLFAAAMDCFASLAMTVCRRCLKIESEEFTEH